MATNGTLAGTPSTTGTPFSGHSSNGMTTQKYETKPNVPYQHLIRPPIIHSPLNLSKVNPKPKIQLLVSNQSYKSSSKLSVAKPLKTKIHVTELR